MEPLLYRMDISTTRDLVWLAWTVPDELTSWLCSRALVEPAVGGAYELYWDAPQGLAAVAGRVLSIQKPRLLEFSWPLPGEEPTEVKVELFPTPGGTRLEVTHRGWPATPAGRGLRQGADALWLRALERLRLAVR